MTRFARVSKRKHLDATPWSELSRGAGSARASNSSKEQNSEKQNSSAMEKQKSLKRKHVDSGYELVSGKKFKKGSSKDKRDEKREKKQSKVKSKEEHLLTKGKPEGKKVCDDEKAEKIREARRQRRKKSKSRSDSESSASTSGESDMVRAKPPSLSSVIFIKRPEKKTLVNAATTKKKELASVVVIKRHEHKEFAHAITADKDSSEKERKVNTPGETGKCLNVSKITPSVESRSSSTKAQSGKSSYNLKTENKTKDNITVDLSSNDSVRKRVVKINRTVFKEGRVASSSEECAGFGAKPRQRHWSSSSDKNTQQSDSVSGHSDQDGDSTQSVNEKIPAPDGGRQVSFSKQTHSLNNGGDTISSFKTQEKHSETESTRTVTLLKQSDVTSTTQQTPPLKKHRLSSTCSSLTERPHFGPSVKIDRTFTKASSLKVSQRTEQCKSLVVTERESKKTPEVNLPSDAPIQTCNQPKSHTKSVSSISKRSSNDGNIDKSQNERKGESEKRPISPVLFPAHSSSSKSHTYHVKERQKSESTKRNTSSSPVYSDEQGQEEIKERNLKKVTSTSTSLDSQQTSRKRRFREVEKRDRIEKSPHGHSKHQRRESSLSPHRKSSNRVSSRSRGSLYSDDYITPVSQRLRWSSGSTTPISDDHRTPRKRRDSSKYVPVSVSPCDRSKPGWHENHEQYKKLCKVPRPYDVLLVGDSIIKGLARYSNVWKKYLAPLNALNFGIGGDQTQHVLWRLQNGELECYPRVVVVHCGTNNINKDSADDIVQGILAIVNYIRDKVADVKVIVVGLLPRDYYPDTFRREKIGSVNRQLEEQISFSDELQEEPVWFLRPEDDWVDEKGRLDKDLYYSDCLHLAELGDEKLAKAISDCVRGLLEEGNSD